MLILPPTVKTNKTIYTLTKWPEKFRFHSVSSKNKTNSIHLSGILTPKVLEKLFLTGFNRVYDSRPGIFVQKFDRDYINIYLKELL